MSDSGGPEVSPKADLHNVSSAMWRAKQRRRAELNVGMDERWKDRLMLSLVVLVSLISRFACSGTGP